VARIIPFKKVPVRKPRRMNPQLLAELIAIHSQCPLQQQGKCALTVFTAPLVWELHKAMNIADDTDKAFRRVDPLCAARPLEPERFETLTPEEIAKSITEEPQ
jgi:hypothetical protein